MKKAVVWKAQGDLAFAFDKDGAPINAIRFADHFRCAVYVEKENAKIAREANKSEKQIDVQSKRLT